MKIVIRLKTRLGGDVIIETTFDDAGLNELSAPELREAAA